VVARPLDSAVGKAGLGHAFVVTHAKFIGDPNATIHSFGKLANGNMGNVSDATRAADASRTAFATDVRAWLALGADATENISGINAPDDLVDQVVAAVMENNPYALVPNSSGTKTTGGRDPMVVPDRTTNSNSGAFGSGDRAQQLATGDPNSRVSRAPFTLTLPGSGASWKVNFNAETGMAKATQSRPTTGTRIRRSVAQCVDKDKC